MNANKVTNTVMYLEYFAVLTHLAYKIGHFLGRKFRHNQTGV